MFEQFQDGQDDLTAKPTARAFDATFQQGEHKVVEVQKFCRHGTLRGQWRNLEQVESALMAWQLAGAVRPRATPFNLNVKLQSSVAVGAKLDQGAVVDEAKVEKPHAPDAPQVKTFQ